MYERSGGVALDGDCREGGTFTFSAIRLKLAFSKISYYTFKFEYNSNFDHIWVKKLELSFSANLTVLENSTFKL